ncbi:MAG: VWA domain-containing protein [Gammaproteobacteria bacterium]|jgi:hypothetical protein
MRRLLIRTVLLFVVTLSAAGCVNHSHSRAVYMLLDTSGTYSKQLDKANAIINYLLGILNSGDTLVVARIDSGSFTEKALVAKATFDDRPSVANAQKREFREKLNTFFKHLKPSAYTDVTGGMLQAAQFLHETPAGQKTILIFSDLDEDLKRGYVRKAIQLPLKDVNVVALNVTKLRSDNVDPRDYIKRLAYWKKRVLKDGGHWRVVNDLDRLDGLLNTN